MPSFDVVSTVDMQEILNAVDQTRREIKARYDFKGSKSKLDLKDEGIEILADDDLKLKAVQEILKQKLAKRGVSLKSIEWKDAVAAAGDMKKQLVLVKQALNNDELRRLNKIVKQQKFKVTAQIQGDQLRIIGKKKDVLQEVIGFLKEEASDLELQFVNYRD